MTRRTCNSLGSMVLILFAITPHAAVARISPSGAAFDVSDDGTFASGTRAMNELRWPDAISAFDQVIAARNGKRIDAALYWKAYCLMKMSHTAEASASCHLLRTRFPASTWNHDCGALTVGVGADGGKGRSESVANSGGMARGSDDDLKLLALNSLAQQDPARAIPVIRNVLAGDLPQEFKKHALFALTQSRSPEATSLLQDAVDGKLGKVVQIDAIQSTGLFEGGRANESLARLYKSSQDKDVKEAVIIAFFVSSDASRMVELARNEKNKEVKRTIIERLALMHDKAATNYMFELLR